MKKRLFVCAVIAICFAIAAYGTMAYFTYEGTATNVITAGNIRIRLLVQAQEPGGQMAPADSAIGVMPGTKVSRIVQVQNTGDHTAWVRIHVDQAITLAQGVEGEIDLTLIGYDLNTEAWTLRDGYYYYNAPLEAGQTTEPIFTKVIFDKTMDDMYQLSTATVHIQAQATQVANNGGSVFEAAGWTNAA